MQGQKEQLIPIQKNREYANIDKGAGVSLIKQLLLRWRHWQLMVNYHAHWAFDHEIMTALVEYFTNSKPLSNNIMREIGRYTLHRKWYLN